MKRMAAMIATALALTTPLASYAMDHDHGSKDMAMEHSHNHTQMDEQCAKECALLLKDCEQEVDSIQQRVQRIKTEIDEKGATTYTVEELKTLNAKLKEANETMKAINKPGH